MGTAGRLFSEVRELRVLAPRSTGQWREDKQTDS